MKKYYVHTNAQLSGEHEVHQEYCIYLPKEEHRVFLGAFTSCAAALQEAKKTYISVDGCKTCSRNCHNR
ncbi:hypothetical protein PQ465_15395 [Sphingobacterium oryzagri]|uniref:Uncharacterized protein n=1 Tax=Sphingobacterium oryzagri TaxID=3025669 RepID=A0ABY7WDX3_9SPHI|nr:hypothetical protein [Sphingobacterium sp. KACC 22765]WDF67685.1 hypothetical protein PQ465_15395 [Sphingobacterium sp. KACC 22765]